MCRPKTPKDNSADLARQQEEARQARIAQGQASIDREFAGFNDDFFDKFRGDFVGAQSPQLAEQFEDAREKTIFGLSRSGLLESSAGADKLAKLQRTRDDAERGIVSGADDAVRGLRTDIANRRSALTSQNRVAASPSEAGVSAAAAAGNLLAPPTPSPLVDVFASLLNTGATAVGSGAFDRRIAGVGSPSGAGAATGRKSVQVIR